MTTIILKELDDVGCFVSSLQVDYNTSIILIKVNICHFLHFAPVFS